MYTYARDSCVGLFLTYCLKLPKSYNELRVIKEQHQCNLENNHHISSHENVAESKLLFKILHLTFFYTDSTYMYRVRYLFLQHDVSRLV